MDQRCPRNLKHLPEEWCYFAVLRLKAVRSAGRELTEDEESKLAGCPWALSCQSANYCFFKYINTIADGSISDIEIASMLNISVDAVRKLERSALNKMRKTDLVREIKEVYGDEKIIPDAIDSSLGGST